MTCSPRSATASSQPITLHAELGGLVMGRKSGRTAPDQITLYKSVGVAVQDAAAHGPGRRVRPRAVNR
ncbi:hypothetical protein [Streptomyces sp. NPDC096324]|uniref:hypothetical protein n=1 Tax=Streptomyces sp. NPDC096324 TaxID=3366085 RepID=UPI0038307AD5